MIDVIPVDLVVAAIIAVAGEALLHADSDDPADAYAGPSVYQVASGVRNPFRYGRLVELVTAWFTEHPLYDQDGQPIVVPEWSFPGRGRVQRQLARATKAMGLAERVVGSLPVRGKQAEWMAALEEQHLLADRALGYVELYGAYTETDALYRVDRLIALWDRMDEDDRAAFCFDPAAVDWAVYVHEIHLPSIIEHARVRTSPGQVDQDQPGRPGQEGHPLARPAPGRLRPREHPDRLQRGRLLRLAGHPTPPRRRTGAFVADLVAEAPALLALDRRDRGDFLRSFYRRYDGAPAARLRDDGWELFHHLLLAKSFPAGIARVRAHRALGHRTILITGALDFVVEPLPPAVRRDRLRPAGRGGRAASPVGSSPPPTGEARALVLADYAESEGLRLEESVAYADSASDLPMLEAVGFPVAVNPEAKLAAIARRRGWHVETLAQGRRRQPARPAPRAARPRGGLGPSAWPHQSRGTGRPGAPDSPGSEHR